MSAQSGCVERMGATSYPARATTPWRPSQAMGEGAIEGTAEDYEIDPNSPYSVFFKFTRFYAQHASPRDVSALTGLRRRVSKVGGLETAFTQGDDLVADAAAGL